MHLDEPLLDEFAGEAALPSYRLARNRSCAVDGDTKILDVPPDETWGPRRFGTILYMLGA
jgi:hypothetical protein